MTKNADMPATPITEGPFPAGAVNTNYGPVMSGLTKREHFAAMAMQGLLSSEVCASHEKFAERAVKSADALLAELEKPNEQN